jgi:PAS domain S-box-containing protein
MIPSRTTTEVWDSIALDLVSIHVEGEIVYINTAGAKMLGAAAPAQLIGRPILDFVHPDYHEIAAGRVRQMIADGLVVCPSKERWLRLDGTAIDVEVAAMRVVYEGKSAVQLMVRKGAGRQSRRLTRSWRCPSRFRR